MAATGVNTVLNAVKRRVFVVGVGMTKFEKPGRRENFDYPDMAKEAGTKALNDAGITFDKVEQACVGYCYGHDYDGGLGPEVRDASGVPGIASLLVFTTAHGVRDTTCGQNAIYRLGLTGIPVYNVNNACSTGSTALFMAKQLVEGGLANCVMALGFEKMERGSLTMKYTDRANPMEQHMGVLAKTFGIESSPFAAQMFGSAGREHMKKYGTKPEHFAKIAYKNHKHSVNNPYSQFRDVYSLEQILASPMIHEPLTKLQCCPTSDGSAAAIVGSEDFVIENGLQDQAIEIIGMSMTTDTPSSFEDSVMKMVGYDLTKRAADKVYKQSGLGPGDVQVVELHDCFATNELITYEALGLCEEGKAGEFIDKGDNTYGGKYVVNPSGGLISKGHPLGATGLAQCSELCWQLRGMADKRQVPGAKVGLQHNLGLGGAAVITMYRHGFPETQQARALHTSAKKSTGNTYLSYPVFESIKSTLSKDGANMVKKVNGTYSFVIAGPDGEATWFVDVKNGNGSVTFGSTEKADCTISVKDQDLLNMATGKLDSQQAFFAGQLKVSGNMGLAMKLKDIMPKLEKSKL